MPRRIYTNIQRRIQEFAMGEADQGFLQFGGAHGERGSASL